MIRYMFYLLLTLLSFQALAVNAAPATEPFPISALPDFTISRSQVLYQRYCLFCHGENGAGDGQNAYSLPQRPPDLGKIISERTPEQLIAVIRGDENDESANSSRRTMPSFGATLSDPQTNQLVKYIQNFLRQEGKAGEDQSL